MKIDINELVHYFDIIEGIKCFHEAHDKCDDVEIKYHAKKMIEVCSKQLGEVVYTLLKDFDKDKFRYYTKLLLKLYEENENGILRSDDSRKRTTD